MLAIKFISYIILSYGITESLVFFNGPFNIFDRFRKILAMISDNLAELISCMFCTSTWIGLFLSLINILVLPTIPLTPFNIILGGTGLWWLILPFDMFATAGIVWLLYSIENALERVGTNKDNDGQ